MSEVDNDQFLDQMEKYYAQSDGVKDARPEVRRSPNIAVCDGARFGVQATCIRRVVVVGLVFL